MDSPPDGTGPEPKICVVESRKRREMIQEVIAVHISILESLKRSIDDIRARIRFLEGERDQIARPQIAEDHAEPPPEI